MNLSKREKIREIKQKIEKLHDFKEDYLINLIFENKIEDLIISYFENPKKHYLIVREIHKILRKKFGYIAVGKSTRKYWMIRGFSEEEANEKAKEIFKKRNKNHQSPLKPEFWIAKGYSKEEANFMVKSCSCFNPEYWILKGYSEEEAKEKAKEKHLEVSRKGGKIKSKKMKENPEKYKKTNPLNKKFWIAKGYSEEEAKEIVSKKQRRFAFDKLIEKHGLIKGYIIWKKRQDEWMKTLNSKSKKEKEEINKKKNPYKRRENETKKEYFERIKNKIKENTRQELIKNDILKYRFYKFYISPQKFWDEFVRYTVKELVNKKDFLKYLEKFYEKDRFNFVKDTFSSKVYDKKTKIMFRSRKEFLFYLLLREHNINFIHEKTYPNSKKRCDFYLPDYDLYIEITGMMEEEEYRKKMEFKKKKFNAILLHNVKDFLNFIKRLTNEKI